MVQAEVGSGGFWIYFEGRASKAIRGLKVRSWGHVSVARRTSGPRGCKVGVAIRCEGEAVSEVPLEGKIRGLVSDTWNLSSPVGTWWR